MPMAAGVRRHSMMMLVVCGQRRGVFVVVVAAACAAARILTRPTTHAPHNQLCGLDSSLCSIVNGLCRFNALSGSLLTQRTA